MDRKKLALYAGIFVGALILGRLLVGTRPPAKVIPIEEGKKRGRKKADGKGE